MELEEPSQGGRPDLQAGSAAGWNNLAQPRSVPPAPLRAPLRVHPGCAPPLAPCTPSGALKRVEGEGRGGLPPWGARRGVETERGEVGGWLWKPWLPPPARKPPAPPSEVARRVCAEGPRRAPAERRVRRHARPPT